MNKYYVGMHILIAVIQLFLSSGRVMGQTNVQHGAYAPLITELTAPDMEQHVIVGWNGDNSPTDELRALWQEDLPSDSLWIRAEIRVVGTVPRDGWFVRVAGVNDLEIQRISSNDLPTNHGWTKMVPGKQISIELHASHPPTFSLEIVSYNFQKPAVATKAYVDGHSDHRVPLISRYKPGSPVYEFSKPIVAVFFPDGSDNGKLVNCTGFLLTESLIITNNHCIDSRTKVGNVQVFLGYDTPSLPLKFEGVRKLELESDQNHLDYSIFQLTSSHPEWGAAQLSVKAPGSNLIVIQHPDGAAKTIAESCPDPGANALIVYAPETADEFHHFCDTSFGSSGSPVMDATTGAIVGLHHRTDKLVKSPNALVFESENIAVRMRNILQDIETRDAAMFQQLSITH